MKKVYLLKVVQHDKESFLGTLSARELVRLATRQELNQTQEAQRPIEPKRLSKIAEFVSEGGTISTSIVIGTKNVDILSVHKVEDAPIPNLYYMDFPETEEEYERCKDAFDIMDGQHRLFSFLDDQIKIDDSVDYDLTFNMYVMPDLRLRRLIFKNTNEEQKQVASNLLLWFRKQLNMLSDKEKTYHGVVELLNSENSSPLKGRIIMGAEKVPGGFKAEQLINIFAKVKIKSINGSELDDEKTFKLISEYLRGWEKAVGVRISERDRELAPFSKISGLRFMMIMLPAFYNEALANHMSMDREFVSKTINTLFANDSLQATDIFNTNGEFIKGLGMNPFSGESATTNFAEDWVNKLKNQASIDFDPLAF
ncbi:MAG: DGQHR domain-containing protein [Candidatus Saccharibacteria bacterium]|nr:DGQHR domain-containing protein [Candidatus Saccharibacteria bacterium]